VPDNEATPLARARTGLLDALDALSPHASAVTLVGAQAVYLWTEGVSLDVEPHTLDADLALTIDLLGDAPRLALAMESGGFNRSGQPGIWRSPGDVQVDLLVPDSHVDPAGRRGARIPKHDNTSARKVRGLEAATVDREERTITSFEGDRSVTAFVAGPMALLVAKAFKLGERAQERGPQPARWRKAGKDTTDLLRLLRGVDAQDFVSRATLIRSDEHAEPVLRKGVGFLVELFEDTSSPGARLLREQASDEGDGLEWSASAVALIKDVVAGLNL
jgi:hypothetical protein